MKRRTQRSATATSTSSSHHYIFMHVHYTPKCGAKTRRTQRKHKRTHQQQLRTKNQRYPSKCGDHTSHYQCRTTSHTRVHKQQPWTCMPCTKHTQTRVRNTHECGANLNTHRVDSDTHPRTHLSAVPCARYPHCTPHSHRHQYY